MFSQLSNSLSRRCARSSLLKLTSQASPASLQQFAQFGATDESGTIKTAWESSCFYKMDYTIKEDESVFEAVKTFSAYKVGALVVTNSEGMFFSSTYYYIVSWN